MYAHRLHLSGTYTSAATCICVSQQDHIAYVIWYLIPLQCVCCVGGYIRHGTASYMLYWGQCNMIYNDDENNLSWS